MGGKYNDALGWIALYQEFCAFLAVQLSLVIQEPEENGRHAMVVFEVSEDCPFIEGEGEG